MHRFLGLICLLTLTQAHAALHGRHAVHARNSAGVSLRKRLHVNGLIAEPGTLELDWGGLYSYTTAGFTMPSALRWTPGGDSLFWGRTEYSVSFDSVSSAIEAGGRTTQFSDRLSIAATSILYDSEHFDIAFSPQATVLMRGDSGARLGATTIARYDGGGNTLGASLSWSGATVPAATNPAGVWDAGIGFGRQLGWKLTRLTPHFNAVLERATGFDRTVAVFGGCEYALSPRAALDAVYQRYGLAGGDPDRQILLSFTFTFGKRR